MLRPEIIDAIALLNWLREHPEYRTRQQILQHASPRRLRSAAELNPILHILAEHNLIVLPKGKPIHVREE